jgi:outer membrane protein W
MRKQLLLIVPLFLALIYLCSCSSGQYKIKDLPESHDTVGVQLDTAELKDFKLVGENSLKGKTFRVRTAPLVTFTLIGNYNLGFAELSSNYANILDADQFKQGENFGVKNGMGVMLTAKIALHKEGNIRLNISGAYNFFKNDLFADASPYGKVKYNVLTFGAGIENNFSPKYRFRPYVAGEITGNLISGDATIKDSANAPETNYKIKSSFRIGYTLYSGIEYLITNQFGLNIGVKLTNSNQVLKSSEGSDSDTEFNLRDKKVNPRIKFSGFKNFVYVSMYLGVNVYFGIKDITYKF